MNTNLLEFNPNAQAKPTEQFQHSSENPSDLDKSQLVRESGLTNDEEQIVVAQIIHAYRTQWATDRIMRMPNWLKNAEFDKGRQVLGWDPITRTYFDAVAWYRQNNQETDYSYLEKYVNNITQMMRRNFCSAVASAVPPVVITPQNAENLADMTTAKASQEAVSIIEEANDIKGMLGLEAQYLYLYGVYFKWTRFVIDGSWVGYKDEPEFGDINVQLSGDHFHCLSCGADTDASQVDINNPDNMRCQNCSSQLRPQDFYPGELDTATAVTGTKERANGLPKWSVFSPLQVDTDPTADCIRETPLLALEMEVDTAQLRANFPKRAQEIREGTESATNDNATYERLVRTLVYSANYTITADIFTQRATYTQVWIQPDSYYRLADNDPLMKKLQKLYPKGSKWSLCGNLVLDVRASVLEKEWSACKLHKGYGLYPPSVADNVVPFNERYNNISNILDDYMERCATGITLADPNRIDIRQLSGKPLTGGVLNPTPTKGAGIEQPLGNAIFHFEFKLDPGLFSYLDRLFNYCQLIAGVPPQVGGIGTQAGVETAKGQKQMLDQAMGALGDIYGFIKVEHAEAGQNAIECLQKNMQYTGSLWSVIEENGSEFRNNYVHLDEMQGRIRVKANTDEGLPMTPTQKRQWVENMMEMAKDNPVIQAWFDIPSNQEMAAEIVGMPGSVTPGSAQRSKTLQDIRKLLQSGPLPAVGPNGQPQIDDDGTAKMMPSLAPNKWVEDYNMLLDTVRQFCAENCDVKDSNPDGWSNVVAYYRLAMQYQSEVQGVMNKLQADAQRAAQPPSKDSDPTIQAMEARLLQQAADAVDNLHELSHVPPALTKNMINGQVSASKELVDTVTKVVTK